MNKQEVNKLLALMKANYSYAFKSMSQQDKFLLLNTWTFTLQDLQADVVMIAAMQLISTSKWLPTVAEIRSQCRSLYFQSVCGIPNSFLYELPEYRKELHPEEIREYERQKSARKYIASATNHLRDDDGNELTLETILGNPAFAQIGTSGGGFSMLENTKYEIDERCEDTHNEYSNFDRQSGF